MKGLEGKSGLMTGSARGIGRAFAQAYVAEGAKVAIADIDFDRAKQTASEIGENAMAVRLDVTDQRSIDEAIKTLEKEWGGIHDIHVLENGNVMVQRMPQLAVP